MEILPKWCKILQKSFNSTKNGGNFPKSGRNSRKNHRNFINYAGNYQKLVGRQKVRNCPKSI